MKEMDPPTRAIVDYIASVDYAAMPAQAVHAVTRNFIDAVACMAAGCDELSARAARAYAKTGSGTPSASAVGVADPVLLDGAVLANGAAIRHGEFHDDEDRRAPRSGIAPALFALAEAAGATPGQFIEAVFVAYQVAMALGDDAPLRDTCFAQSLHVSIGVVAGASKLLALDGNQRANAIAIALAPSIPMRVPERQSGLTWGSVASAHAAMTAIFAARLASMGITGPPHVFDGPGALWDKVTGPFEFTGISRTRGHARNPLSDDQLTAKFEAWVAGRLSRKLLDELRGRLWNLPREPGLGPIAALLRAFSAAE